MMKIRLFSCFFVSVSVRWLLGLFFSMSAVLSAQKNDSPGFGHVVNLENLKDSTPVITSRERVFIERKYFLNPDSVLFDKAMLVNSFWQLNELKPFYEDKNALVLWDITVKLLFSDAGFEPINCENLYKNRLRNASADDRVDYRRKLNEVLGGELYANLQFCLNYLGMRYSDREVWQAYASERILLFSDLLAMQAIGIRLKAFVIAVDVLYSMCIPQHPDVTSLVPIQLSNAKGH